MSEDARRSTTVGVAAYLALAFGIAWASWALLLPFAAGDPARTQLCLLPGAFGPALATFIVRKWVTREGFADAGLGLHLRQWRYYLIAWFLPLGVVAFIVLCALVLDAGHPDFTMTTALAHYAPHANIPPSLHGRIGYVIPLQLVITTPFMAPVLFGEEFGWRGYLQLRLSAQNPTLAAVATGIIWGLWHLPILLRGYEFQGNRDFTSAIAIFCAGTVIISIIFGWLRRRSGSIWATSLAHAATNVIGGSLTALWFTTQPFLVGYLGLLSWVPLGLFSVWIVLRGDRADAARSR